MKRNETSPPALALVAGAGALLVTAGLILSGCAAMGGDRVTVRQLESKACASVAQVVNEAQHRMYEGNRYALAEAGDRLRDRSILPDGDLMLRIDEAAERLPQIRDDTQIDPGQVARVNYDLAEISAVCEKLGHDAFPALMFPEEQDLRDLLTGEPGWGPEGEDQPMKSLSELLGGDDDDE